MNDIAPSSGGSGADRATAAASHPGSAGEFPQAAHSDTTLVLSPEREELLHQVQLDRDELTDVAQRLSGPIQTLKTARTVVVLTARTLRWITLAGEVIVVATWLRTGRRPPLALLFGISLQLFSAWSGRNSAAKPADAVVRRAA